MFNFTPLLGARTASPASQSLLEFEGGIKVLVDVGWDSDFEVAKLQALEKEVPTLSLVLLTHATPSHIAAFAYCCKHVPLFIQVPVYATQPVIYLGRTLLQDIYSSTPLAASVVPKSSLQAPESAGDGPNILLQPPSREEIASYFQSIHPLKYSQPHEPLASPFSPPLNGLTITAYNAGHSLGGTIWHITHGMESIVYAVDWNQVRENVYNRAAWLTGGGGAEIIEQLQKPTALVCSTRGVEQTPLAGGRSKRDDTLLEEIRSVLLEGGTVLLPTDASARVLELAYVIEHAWRQQSKLNIDHPFKTAKVYLAGKTMSTTLRYARSMLEWMDENVVREADIDSAAAATSSKPGDLKSSGQDSNQGPKGGAKTGPLDFKFIKVIERKPHFEKMLSKSGPKVIIASDETLAWGYSKDAFVHIASDTKSLVILTDNSTLCQDGGTQAMDYIGQTLWQWYQHRDSSMASNIEMGGRAAAPKSFGGATLKYKVAIRTPLQGTALDRYQQHLLAQRQLQESSGASGDTHLEMTADVVNDTASTNSSESEESDSEQQGKALNYSNAISQATRSRLAGGETQGVNALLIQTNVFDYDVRGKKGRESVYPFLTKRRRVDEFGELIRPEDYLRAEEKDDADDITSGKEDERNAELGQKRKWAELDFAAQRGQRHAQGSKRRKQALVDNNYDGNDDDDSSLDPTSDYEEEESLPPSEVTFKDCSIDVHLRVAYVDFSGLHDQRNMSLLIPLIKPRKIVLVGGNEAETQYLARECRNKLLDGASHASDLLVPRNGETVQASMDTNAWTIRLSEQLVQRIRWQSVGGRDVVTLTGNLGATRIYEPIDRNESRLKRPKLLNGEEDTSSPAEMPKVVVGGENLEQAYVQPTLDVLPASLVGATRTIAQPLHVGDLRLADLRKMLLGEGYSAEFRGQGTLVIDGRVAIRKTAGGKLEVESGEGMGERQDISRRREMPFFAVKKRIYEGLAVIAGQ